MAGRWTLLLLGLWLFAGCKLKAGDDDDVTPTKIDTDKIRDVVEDTVEEVRDAEICDGMTLEELFEADSFSDECRNQLLSFLPEPESTFEANMVAPGGARMVDGELRVLVQAADADGVAISAEALSALEIEVVVDGTARTLVDGEFEIALSADLPTDLISIAVVNDYSASMLERDLRDVAELEAALFECMPPVHETEVIRFSEQVETLLPFTSDSEMIAGALAFDESFDRGTTALIDGLGTAAGDLGGAARPVKILVLSSDGRENASMLFEESDMLEALDDEQVFVVAFGALLADVDFMRDLTRGRGVFVYTREFKALQQAAMPYLESLKEMIEVRIAMSDPPPTAIELKVEDLALSLDIAP